MGWEGGNWRFTYDALEEEGLDTHTHTADPNGLAYVGAMWSQVGLCWAHMGSKLAPSGAMQGLSWPVGGLDGAHVGASWGYHVTQDHCWPMLGLCGAKLAPC